VGHLLPGITGSPGAYAIVGMGAVFAAAARAPITAVLIIFELTGDYGVIVPLMLSAFVAAATSRALERESLYTAPLRRRGVALPELPRPDWLRVTPIREIVQPGFATVTPETPFKAVVTQLLTLPAGSDLYVVGEDGAFVGAITLEGLKGHIGQEGHLSMIVASDVMDRSVEPLTTSMRLADAASRFADALGEQLPVVDERRRLVGTASKRDLLKLGRF
jgi:CIC family chloride channel protein